MNIFLKEIMQPVLGNIEKFGDRNAFLIKDKYYTYKDFGECVSMIRKALIKKENKNTNVGLVLNDDLQTYASIFAIWLEGKSYVPLHPGWPMDRVLDIIEQVEIELVLDSSVKTRYAENLVLNTQVLIFSEPSLQNMHEYSDDELAYILFTSGSTGKPKGVQLTKGNLGYFMESFFRTGITVDEEDRCLQCFDLSFDVSVQGYLVSLTRGACCYTVPYDKVKYVYAGELIDQYKLTFGAMAPSMLRYLKPYFNQIDAKSLKNCILTAEACPLDLMEAWFKVAKNTEIWDFYGPTECTIYATYYMVHRDVQNKTHNGIISIGKPFSNVDVLILDEEENEVKAGKKGELCLSGGQLTTGYWKDDEKNKEAFFMRDGKRFYHTGDICYMNDGDIMYAGRMDSQTKIQGFRVELGEIEYHARVYSSVNCIALAFDNKEHLTEIALFIEKDKEDTTELVNYLRSKMPSYMIPKVFYFVPVFPLNGNDKTDKNKLRNMIKID